MTDKEFEQEAQLLRPVMVAVARDFFGNDNDAEDVAQDGLLALWRYRDRMDSGKNHKPLAIRIAKHCCMDMVRRRKEIIPLYNNKVEDDTAPPASTASPSPHDNLEEQELHNAMNEAVQNLKPNERRLFELRQIEGKSIDEIANETHITKPSIKSIVSSARRKIFEELKQKMKLER